MAEQQNTVDENSRTWRAVKEWADKRMTSSRASLEAQGLEPVQTEFERGRIAAAKELMNLPKQNMINTTYSADSHVE